MICGTRGIATGDHFWITDRRDEKTDRWAEKNGIQAIRYDAAHGHEVVLGEIAADLHKYASLDVPAPPVVGTSSGTASTLPTPSELARQDPESIRRLLSARAAELLRSTDDASIKSYEDMRTQYARAMHNAYYFSLKSPENVFFGHALEAQLGTGAFGDVYRARDSGGEEVAIKILRPEVMAKPEMLASFRRGVRSMRILSTRNVSGMIPYREAYEMPACVVMNLVQGPNLQQAVEARRIDPWSDGLRIAVEVGGIIRRAHMLPERVLHRDIRPPNIMLSGFDNSPNAWEVVVLDFDMSWHKGSTEKSIVDLSTGTALGYLAPEQLAPSKRYSTRSTAVDAFGLGATIFFIFSRTHPTAGKALSHDWPQEVRDAFSSIPCSSWKSAGERMARLVIKCTIAAQDKRPDMGRLYDELTRVRAAVLTPNAVESAELWAEELTMRAVGAKYSWNSDLLEATVETPTGWSMGVRGDEVSGRVNLSSGWVNCGLHNRRDVTRYIPAAMEKSLSILKKNGWNVTSSNAESQSLRIEASLCIADAPRLLEKASSGLATHSQAMRFE